ncbi:MAG: alpha/beta hydrolase [Deltaproteobacteria bacterium]|nr:alpha/beta hydrolase [Deltaproteobacteria bacterium]
MEAKKPAERLDDLRTLPEGWHPTSRIVRAGGIDVHYVRSPATGTQPRPVLLLVHGFLVSSFSWRHQLDALGDRFDVVAPCLKGFGWSERAHGDYSLDALGRFLIDFMDALGIARAHVCGNSLGGALALWLCHHQPERVDRLVLVNSLALTRTLPSVPTPLAGPWMAPLARLFVRPTLARLGLSALAYRGIPVDSAYMAGFRPPFEHPRSVPIALQVARGLPAAVAHVEPILDALQHRTLVVQGVGDRLLSARAGLQIARRVPGARLVSFDGSGHCPHEEEPERFNAVLRDFLDGDG